MLEIKKEGERCGARIQIENRNRKLNQHCNRAISNISLSTPKLFPFAVRFLATLTPATH